MSAGNVVWEYMLWKFYRRYWREWWLSPIVRLTESTWTDGTESGTLLFRRNWLIGGYHTFIKSISNIETEFVAVKTRQDHLWMNLGPSVLKHEIGEVQKNTFGQLSTRRIQMKSMITEEHFFLIHLTTFGSTEASRCGENALLNVSDLGRTTRLPVAEKHPASIMREWPKLLKSHSLIHSVTGINRSQKLNGLKSIWARIRITTHYQYHISSIYLFSTPLFRLQRIPIFCIYEIQVQYEHPK